LEQSGRFKEKTAAYVIKQVLLATKHLHDRGICHRDLKPENILVENNSESHPQIRIIDFGFAQYFDRDKNGGYGSFFTSRAGSPYYMAPEVIQGNYDYKCDLWSIGVITYVLIAGYPPFNSDNDAKLFRQIELCDYEFHDDVWNSISSDCIKFIQKLLQPNLKHRIGIDEALNHPWMTGFAPNKLPDKSILMRLK